MAFLAGGYKTPEALAADIDELSRSTALFGAKLFARDPPASIPQRSGHMRTNSVKTPLGSGSTLTWCRSWTTTRGLRSLLSFTFALPTSGVIRKLRQVAPHNLAAAR